MKLMILALSIFVAAAAQAKSTSEYTSLDDCKTIRSSENDPNAEIDYFTSVCKGRDGFRVMYSGGDARSWIDLLAKGESVTNVNDSSLSMDERQGYFPNIAGRKLEWRYTDGKLNSLIVRTSGQDPETNKPLDHLTVIRVDLKKKEKGCVIGVLNARMKTANEKARALADSKVVCSLR